jgi:hypothetical protein
MNALNAKDLCTAKQRINAANNFFRIVVLQLQYFTGKSTRNSSVAISNVHKALTA